MSPKLTLPMMPFYVRDYLAATRHMTLAERGAYTDLLFFSWDSGAPIPKDPTRIAAMIGCTPKVFSRIWPSLREKFIETERGYVSERLEAEREHSLDLREKASKKASDAARAKWEKTRGADASSTAPSIPEAMLEQCPPSPSPSPSSAPKEAGADAGFGPPVEPITGARTPLSPAATEIARKPTNGRSGIHESAAESPEVQRRRMEAARLVEKAQRAEKARSRP